MPERVCRSASAGVARASCAHGAGLQGPPAALSGRPFWKVILTPHHGCQSGSSNSLRDAEPRLAWGLQSARASPWGVSRAAGHLPVHRNWPPPPSCHPTDPQPHGHSLLLLHGRPGNVTLRAEQALS